MNRIIYGLPNSKYHFGDKYKDYLSSSQLKIYDKSPAAYKYTIGHPQEETDSMRFGSLFHKAMQMFAEGVTPDAFSKYFRERIAVFEPPVNDKTGKHYGAATKVYKEAYDAFLQANDGKPIATDEDVELIRNMTLSLLCGCGATSMQVRKLLKWGKPEVSIFYQTEDGIKLKVRPDLLTSSKIIDWKTISSDDLNEEAINRVILKYGYHISAAMYQYVAHKVLGKWLDFYLVFVSKLPPFDAVMVNMANYSYRYLPDVDIVIQGCGALKFKRLLDLHIKCTKENQWPGAETFISGDKYRIMEIVPPKYYANRFLDEDSF